MNPRFNILVLGLVALFGMSAVAAPVSGEIEAIDTKTRQITVSHGGFTTFNYRPSVTVTFNGQPSSIQQLDVGHSVVITSNETGIASGIAATAPKPKSKPSPAHSPATPDALNKNLPGTTWSWRRPGATSNGAITFKSDGTGNHTHGPFQWQPTGARSVTIIERGRHAELTFDAAISSFTGTDFDSQYRIEGKRK